MGVTSYGSGYGDWIVTKPEHWVYEGTGLKLGDKIPAVIGWEYHGAPLAEIPGLEVLASSALFPRKSRSNPDQQHSAIVYPCSKGNWVFNAGTIWWPEHLSCPPGHIPARTYSGPFGINAHIERVTSNVLNRMIQDAPRRRASRIDFRESRNRSR
jgi:hypothetical protein